MNDNMLDIELLRNRAALYRMLATLYFKPLSSEQIEALASSDFSSLATEENSPFAEAYADLGGALRLRHTGTKEQLAADYTGAFYGIRTHKGRTAQPFESLFRTGGKAELMGEARSEVYRELKRQKLKVPDGIDLPEDHLSFIFEYLGLLCDQAATLLQSGNHAEGEAILETQRDFFVAHVDSWINSFIAQGRLMVETRFYRGVLKLTEAFVAEEKELLENGGER
ncbi:TorD/DmsD family molecular chaperone [Parvibacter caecicola]|uniref:Molecular chaperone TorD n=1 Tax=Parvibacter caecicola TaxID=747645 RepID=A0A4T9T9I1_9ACTN|nr:molecular chaperone TorD family protein [Parvibacter caecicola]TJW09705.1 hypothetical protein E5982_08630 [Parvibacter caecicola]